MTRAITRGVDAGERALVDALVGCEDGAEQMAAISGLVQVAVARTLELGGPRGLDNLLRLSVNEGFERWIRVVRAGKRI